MYLISQAEGFAKDLVGDDILKFKITLNFVDDEDDEDDNIKFLILVARKEATSVAKLKEKITTDFVKIGIPDATERQLDANNEKVKRLPKVLSQPMKLNSLAL